ncbi:MAG: amidohydrolase [Blautia sp.]|nr:amidohydrolase [Blautia sp.]
MIRIIDSHCHIYPDGIALKAVNAVDHFYDKLPTCHYDGTVATLLSSGKEAGISHFIVHSVATSPQQVSRINQFLARSVAESEGHFTGLGTMHPESEDLKGDLREIMALGLKGIKIHPDIQKFPVDSPSAMRIFELCEDQGLPICVHTGDYRYDYSNPSRVERVLKAFPRLKFIGAHFGGWSVWKEALNKLSDYPNLTVDTSSSFFWLTLDQTRELVKGYGPERVMFGTDYPFWPQKQDIDHLLKLDLSDEDYEEIFWKNVTDLFHIS